MSDFGFGAPPTGALEEEANPIGVPAGFTAKRTGDTITSGVHEPFYGPATHATLNTEVPPRYNEGMEWEPGSWSPERIADLQSQMVDAGILGKGDYQRGFWDADSAAAYKKLLAYSNAAGLDYQATLQRYNEVIAKYGRNEAPGRERAPFIGNQIDPERLHLLVDDISVRLMGHGLTPEQKARFTTAFNESRVAAQRQDYEMRGSGLPGGEGGIVTEPDPEAQAEKFIRETAPAEVGANQYLSAFKAFESLIARTRR